MSAPPVPPFLEHPGRRPFSFYPPIRNIPHNKWFYRKASWSEVQVENTRTHEDVWIPRRYLGDISRLDEPVMMVTLTKELEWQAGRILPAQRHVIEMPQRPAAEDAVPSRSAPVVGIRVEDGSPSRLLKLLVGGVSLGIVGCVLLVSFYRGGVLGNHMYAPVSQSDPGLGPQDDRESVIRRMGSPAAEHWQDGLGVLAYPRRGLYIVLNGGRYIGALDGNWNPVRTVELPGQGNSGPILRGVPRY